MKGSIKNFTLIFFIFLMPFLKAQKNDDKIFFGPNKKEFKSEEYKELKSDFNLIEQLEKIEIHEDSSQFGVGYGVEKGDDYIVFTYDSLSSKGNYSEKYRGSGARDLNDGVQPNSRDSFQKKKFKRRTAQERAENKKRRVRESQLKRVQHENLRDQPRSEKYKQSKQSDNGMIFLRIILVAIVIGVSAYILFVRSPVAVSSVRVSYEQEMNPDSINLSDLETKIKRAKNTKDFRLATRLYFVWIIKELSDKEYIKWKKRKTNYNYQSEVLNEPFAEDFKKSIKNYEFIWYGKYDILSDDFKSVEKSFKVLINKIK